jgi:hypothetical protein
LKNCGNCGAELSDTALFCPSCGASDTAGVKSGRLNESKQQLTLPKTVFYVVIIALALMGFVVVGLAVRGPGTVIQTSYVTQMQLTTFSVSFTSSTTITQAYTMTEASFTTLASGPPPTWFSQQYCGYPFNPYVCNEGPPVTVTVYLTNDSSCVDLSVVAGANYVVWNLPKSEPQGAYQVYGFVYPNWPPSQPFPPYPFQKTLCEGIPMWAIPPYIQTA